LELDDKKQISDFYPADQSSVVS